MDDQAQFGRKAGLLVGGSSTNPNDFLDLSETHFRFQTSQCDVESPNNASIRVYNLSEATVRNVRKEFTRVILQAGYKGSYGVIFDGTIKQFRIGRENATDTYLDILAADGDLAYNNAVVNMSLAAANTSPADRTNAALSAFTPFGIQSGSIAPATGGVLPRGKVLFGMARIFLRQLAQSQGATWSIQNGKINIVPLDGYLPGDAVVLNSQTGLIGRPEQTVEGLRARCLLNPKIVIGGLVKIDNASVNQTVQRDPNGALLAFNQYKGLQLLADVTADGIYRVFVAEHDGDTRGQSWYTDLVCLAVDQATKKVHPYG